MADNKLSRVARFDDGFIDDDDPLAELARIVGQSAPKERIQESVAIRREPEFDLEDELMREFEKFDAPFRDAARSVMNASKAADIAAPTSVPEYSGEPVLAAAEPVYHSIPAQQDQPTPNVELVAEPDEPEIVFSAPAFDFSDFETDGETDQDTLDDPIFSELANVAAPVQRQQEPSTQAPIKASEVPVSAFAEWKTDRLETRPEPLAPVMPSLRADPVFAEVPADQRVASYSNAPAISDMLSDAERYPIVPGAAAQIRPKLATPVLRPQADEVKVTSSLFDEPLKVAAAKPVAKAADWKGDALSDPFENADFAIDFESIEQELSDMAQVAPSISHVGNDSRSGWEKADNRNASALHFDPSQISETEDHLETISDLEVPNLPIVEKDDHVASTPDYFMEIDTEMGSLFDETMDERARAAFADKRKEIEASVSGAAASAANRIQSVDQFERDLEEDFRQSLLETSSRDADNRHAYIRQASDFEDNFDRSSDYQPERQVNRFGGMMALAAATVVILGGIGYYLWNHTSLNTAVNSGEPRIILADKEPAKIVPEDKGGQSVPNQDKAVYDKVAGANTEDPKQKTLISSSEDPVDVVQKTLAPEAGTETPLQPSATETTDTQDNRLLPNAAPATQTAEATSAQQPTIAPRKVKTMIVRADGTLVQRDDGQTDTGSTTATVKPDATAKSSTPDATSAANKVDITAKPVPALAQSTATTPAVKQATAAVPLPPASNGGKNDTRLTANGETKTANSTAGDPSSTAANTDVPLIVPAHKVKATTPGKAPVPSARPADQPVNVVGTVTEKGNVVASEAATKPVNQAQTPVAQQPVEVASAQPAAQTATSSGSFGMQVASFPSEEEAKKAFAGLKSKYGGFLSGRDLEIRKAEIEGMGTRYRVRVPVGSKDEAAALCVKYRAAGGSCLVSK